MMTSMTTMSNKSVTTTLTTTVLILSDLREFIEDTKDLPGDAHVSYTYYRGDQFDLTTLTFSVTRSMNHRR